MPLDKLDIEELQRRIEELRQRLSNDIAQSKSFNECMEEMRPSLTPEGLEHHGQVHFFNLGYGLAAERVIDFLETYLIVKPEEGGD